MTSEFRRFGTLAAVTDSLNLLDLEPDLSLLIARPWMETGSTLDVLLLVFLVRIEDLALPLPSPLGLYSSMSGDMSD